MELTFVSEKSFRINYGIEFSLEKHHQLLYIRDQLLNIDAITEAVVGYTTLTVYFNPFRLTYNEVRKVVVPYLTQQAENQPNGNVIKIPVCYEGEFAPDMQVVADYHAIDTNEVIRLHSERNYQVLFLGFAPGFPFLSEVDSKIATPRKNNPRREVHRGSVGIAGKQTGIYPSPSPGGWQIIGRTPVHLLPMKENQPTLVQPGDFIRFYPISQQEFFNLQEFEHK